MEILVVLACEVHVCCCSAFSIEFGQVRSIAVECEHHVTCEIADGGIWVCCAIIEELMACIKYGSCPFCLPPGDGAGCRGESGVNGLAKIEEDSHHLLDVLDLFRCEWGCVVFWRGSLICPEIERHRFVQCVLWFSWLLCWKLCRAAVMYVGMLSLTVHFV